MQVPIYSTKQDAKIRTFKGQIYGFLEYFFINAVSKNICGLIFVSNYETRKHLDKCKISQQIVLTAV